MQSSEINLSELFPAKDADEKTRLNLETLDQLEAAPAALTGISNRSIP